MSRADSRAPSAAFARRVVGAPLTDALPSQQNPRRPPGTRLQWRTGEAPCGAVVLQCAAARSLAQMSRDSKEKMRALRGERLEKRKIKSRARRPPPVYARRRSAAVGFWTRRCGGRDGRSGTAALSPVLCARYFCMVYGRQLANWRYFADKIRHNFQK